jgi:hypothetical protein
MFFVNQRWLGGTLTNFATIRKRVGRLQSLHDMEAKGQFDALPKKEVIKLIAEREKLEKNLGGIKNMSRLPGALFIVDPARSIWPSPKAASWASHRRHRGHQLRSRRGGLSHPLATTMPFAPSSSLPPTWPTPYSRVGRAYRWRTRR